MTDEPDRDAESSQFWAWCQFGRVVLVLFSLFWPVWLAVKAQGPADARAKGPVAKTTCPAAAFTARQAGSREFRTLGENADVYPGDLLVGLPGASLETKTGVALTSLADYDGRSPLPLLDSAVMLHPAADADLDFTLDRGRVDVTNKKPQGAAVVRVRFWNQQWLVTLTTPGDRVAVELYGRWPAGSRFRPVSVGEVSPPSPTGSLNLTVLKGSAEVKVGGVTFGLRAPPGLAQLEWDSVAGLRPQPRKLDTLPEWAEEGRAKTAEGRKAAEAVEKFRKARAENADAAVEAFLRSADPAERRVALVTLGATDDLERLAKVLAGTKSLDEWDFGITVLRHWLGRCPGQDQALYSGLQAVRGLSPTQARVVMQLLFGVAPDDLRRPETYEVLIEYLRHDRSAIRNLAAWHLVRLVPQGKSIPFNPAGTAAEAAAAYAAWKKLIPDGQLPPAAKKP